MPPVEPRAHAPPLAMRTLLRHRDELGEGGRRMEAAGMPIALVML